jgi:outer membrane protein assembly factor BamE (lipoprotein component of BamABCDE complex)
VTRVNVATRTVTVLVLLLGVTLGGCSAALHPHATLEGRYFPSHKFPDVHVGQSADDVKAVLGEPLDSATRGDITEWRYFERPQPRECTYKFLGLVPMSGRHVRTVEVRVAFRDGVVSAMQIQRDPDDGK